MAFEAIEKSPEVAPLLVKLYDTHSLYALAENKDAASCLELTTVMTDLMSIKLSDKESELITDVLLGLMKQAEKDLKLALAERLSAMENAPLRMILTMANDDIDIADPVLRSSPVLQDLDLLYILQSKGVSHGRAMAFRQGLSASVIDMLAGTKDFEIAVTLCENDGINLTERAFDIFAKMAIERKALAKPLLSREDLPQDVAGQLYQFVSDELKAVLQDRFGIGAAPVIAALEDVSIEMISTRTQKTHEEVDSLMAYAHNQQRRGELKLPGIVAALRRGQLSTFVAQFAVFMGLPVDTVKAMMRQESGKGLAMACRALDVPKADFVSLYLLTDRFRSAQKRVINHKELTRVMTMYDGIDPDEARKVLKNSRH
jgi:uncharacterized protein (DUF2336 family)